MGSIRSTFRPLVWLDARTPSEHRRSRYVFKASWTNTVNLLDNEIALLGARDYVIEADFTESDIRLDGMIRANARQPQFPGIRVSFQSRYGPLQYQTDSCTYWQHNVRSIALGLESLRAVKRYGIAEHGEQYRGYRAIESGAMAMPQGSQAMTKERAVALFVEKSGYTVEQLLIPGYLRSAYIKIARQLHPDIDGGDETAMQELNEAHKVLREGGVA